MEVDSLAILKNKTQGLYVNVSKEILTDRRLSLRDRGMLVTVLSLSDNWDFNIRGFAKILPDGVDCIRSSVNELMKRGYLTGGQERSEGGRFGKNVIEVHQIPRLPYLENPYTEEPVANVTKSESSDTDNPRQVSNNKVNNIKLMSHQSVYEDDGKKELQSLEHLVNISTYQEIRTILTYENLLREINECSLSRLEIKKRVIDELKILISYEVFRSTVDVTMVDALLDYMSEIIAVGKNVLFQDATYDTDTMGNQFYQLDSGAVQYVLEKFTKASQITRIKNKKSYLIRMLITAKSDMQTDIVGDVNYDMAHWYERGLNNVSI